MHYVYITRTGLNDYSASDYYLSYMYVCSFSCILLPDYLFCSLFMDLFMESSDLLLTVKGWSGRIGIP